AQSPLPVHGVGRGTHCPLTRSHICPAPHSEFFLQETPASPPPAPELPLVPPLPPPPLPPLPPTAPPASEPLSNALPPPHAPTRAMDAKNPAPTSTASVR